MIDYEMRRGRLVADPVIRYTPNGAKCAEFTLAQSTSRKNEQSGQWETVRELFIDCTIWVQTVGEREIDWPALVEAQLFKGATVAVFGHLATQKWQDNHGNNRSKIGFNAREVYLLLTASADNPPSTAAPSNTAWGTPAAPAPGTNDEPPF